MSVVFIQRVSNNKGLVILLLLGLDIGTSSAKAVLFDPERGQTVAVAAQEYPIDRPAPDRAEQNPDDWWAAAAAITRAVLAGAGVTGDAVAAVSFSGQMHGLVPLDASLKPIRPAIIWADQRSGAEVEVLVAGVGADRYAEIAGTLPAVGFLGPTLLWLSRHEPDTFRRLRWALSPKDYVRLRMTGEVFSEVSDAAGCGIFDISHRCWAAELLEPVGFSVDVLPPVLESTSPAGRLGLDAAAEMGLRAGIPVIAGCADQPAQAVGNGLIAPGRASVTTGSGGQVFTPLALAPGTCVPTDPRLHVFNHAVPGMVYVLGAILSAGLNLRWLRGIVGLTDAPDAYAQFSAEAAAVAPGADGLLFLPYLSGERTPHRDPLARGAFIGLTAFHTRGHMARAVMEGVAFALRQALEISRGLGGQVDMIIAAGGGAESAVWRQIQADVFGVALRQTLQTEQACVGAALIAGVGAGAFPSLEAACAGAVQLGAQTDPRPAYTDFYNEVYQQYLTLYPLLQTQFHQLAQRKQPHPPP